VSKIKASFRSPGIPKRYHEVKKNIHIDLRWAGVGRRGRVLVPRSNRAPVCENGITTVYYNTLNGELKVRRKAFLNVIYVLQPTDSWYMFISCLKSLSSPVQPFTTRSYCVY